MNDIFMRLLMQWMQQRPQNSASKSSNYPIMPREGLMFSPLSRQSGGVSPEMQWQQQQIQRAESELELYRKYPFLLDYGRDQPQPGGWA